VHTAAVPFSRVLIVDDEELVLNMLQRTIERSGRTALCAQTIDQGLSHLAELEQSIDLVITDVHLSADGGSGVQIARAAAARFPAPPVIAITGGASTEEGIELGRAGISKLLAKPFLPHALIDAIESLAPPQMSELDAVVRRSVGARPMRELLDEIRRSMVLEALARTGNNKAQAAVLLGISRQHLQQLLARGQA